MYYTLPCTEMNLSVTTEARAKVIGEGGAHAHRLSTPEKTLNDGLHKHLFFIKDRLVMTELDGAHWHPVEPAANVVGSEGEPRHSHRVLLNTESGIQEFRTFDATTHTHELQVETTTLSGLHIHSLKLGGEIYLSLLPGDLIQEVESAAKSSRQHRDLKLRHCAAATPLEMDFHLIKRLNREDLKATLAVAAVAALLKSLSRLSDGLRIHALILSKERFSDIGLARRFVMDHGLLVRGSDDKDGVYTFLVMTQDKFQEATLQRVRLTEGVEAVVGFLSEEPAAAPPLEVSPAASLPENATTSEATAEVRSDTMAGATDLNAARIAKLKALRQKLSHVKARYGDDVVAKRASTGEVIKGAFYCPILKQNAERRLVSGPVLIPEKTDLQNEVIGVGEIERAAHNYMIKLTFQNDPDFLATLGLGRRAERGFMHVEFNRKIAVVESYTAPVDFTIEGRAVVKGTWILTVKVFDDEVWNLVKAGKITGFSIGGRARLIDDVGKTCLFPDLTELQWEAA